MRCLLILGHAVIAALLIFPATAGARLVVSCPHLVLSSSDLVAVATVTSEQLRQDVRQYTVMISQVLRGDAAAGDSLMVLVRPYRPLTEPPTALPEVGSEIFVALASDEGHWRLSSQLNAVGLVIDRGVATIHAGASVGVEGEEWQPEDYVMAYDAFYREIRNERRQRPSAAKPALTT